MSQPDESAQSVHSTPSKARAKSEKYTKESMDDDLRNDVLNYTCKGIPFNDFLKLAFNLTEEEHAKLLNDVELWAVHDSEEYKTELRKFVAHRKEDQLYKPFVNMGNMILKRAESERNMANERRIKLLQVEKEKMPGGYADRKPDVVLAPDNAYGKKDMVKVDAAPSWTQEMRTRTMSAAPSLRMSSKRIHSPKASPKIEAD
ncbi:hypothetical protein DFH11DRAFT_1648118 [Phellopilus nigrolimitatus]|nr:hypothetical protein DFH11DRAFT_1648118 [Phellopilus nigrolimitatus]